MGGPSKMYQNKEEVMQKQEFKKIRLGTIHTLEYRNIPSQKGLAGMEVIKTFQVRFNDYEAMSKVKDFRASTGEMPNNPAIVNEVQTDVKFVFYNTKTKKLKLRVPLQGCKELSAVYKIDGKEVAKEKYFEEWSKRGYALPKKSKSKTEVEFRSFDLEKIVYFK